jgi:serine/threonine protein kinase
VTSRQLIAPVQESIVVAAVGPIVAARWLGADERVILASLADRSERVVKLVHPDAVAAISDLYRALPDHHGIVPLLGGGVVGEFGYLVHPVQPRTLADLIARTSLAGADAAALLRPVASGLSMLHDAGWVHGDVKPANVLITADGRSLLVSRVISSLTVWDHGSCRPQRGRSATLTG